MRRQMHQHSIIVQLNNTRSRWWRVGYFEYCNQGVQKILIHLVYLTELKKVLEQLEPSQVFEIQIAVQNQRMKFVIREIRLVA